MCSTWVASIIANIHARSDPANGIPLAASSIAVLIPCSYCGIVIILARPAPYKLLIIKPANNSEVYKKAQDSTSFRIYAVCSMKNPIRVSTESLSVFPRSVDDEFMARHLIFSINHTDTIPTMNATATAIHRVPENERNGVRHGAIKRALGTSTVTPDLPIGTVKAANR